MKKFLLRLALLAVILLALDLVAGQAFPYLWHRVKGGNYVRVQYFEKDIHEDVLVFGSSRSVHHYNPQILSDSLGLSCYNCGQGGMGILTAYGWWSVIRAYHRPRVVLYEITPGFDLLERDDNHKFLGPLKELYDYEGVSRIFADVDKTERWKMMSRLYRYNSKALTILSNCFLTSRVTVVGSGFQPIDKMFDPMRVGKEDEATDYRFDSLKVGYLDRFFGELLDDGVEVVCVLSPLWLGKRNYADLAPFFEICKRRNIPFLDFANNPKYVHQNEYFYDAGHLNAVGADEFSRDLASELKARGLLDGIRRECQMEK